MNKKIKKLRIAIVTDWLTDSAGAEKVLFEMLQLFPQAEIFTSIFSRENFPFLKQFKIHTTFLQKLPRFLRKRHQFLLPLFPLAFSLLKFDNFDLVISSSSSGFSKCINLPQKTKHICYCHTPIRFLYNAREEYLTTYPLPWFLRPFKILLPFLLNWLTKIDQKFAKKVDFWVANSDYIGKRIKKYYYSEATTIYPGIELDKYLIQKKNSREKSYFVAVARFIPYKKFDLLIKTFAKNGLPLKLAGTGPELEKCKKLANSLQAKNITFLGFVAEKDLSNLYAKARAFLFPAEEDFGITPVEAMASGTPVIYFNKGGAIESVGKYGVAFNSQTVDSLQKAINDFLKLEKEFSGYREKAWRESLQSRAKKFSNKKFRENLLKLVETKIV